MHFELSNVVNGQILKKMLTSNKAETNLLAKYGPIAVKLLSKKKDPNDLNDELSAIK